MHAVERLARRLDRLQQRSPVVGFALAVIKKFGDDRCSALSAQLAYYGFMALFPLLLVLTTILAFVGGATVEDNVIATTLNQFPVLGQQIGRAAPHPLTGSGVGLAIGLAGLLYGSLGLAQAAQHALAQVWNVRGVVRPGFLPRLARSVLFFTVAGAAMAAGTALSGMATLTGRGLLWRLVFLLATAGLNVALYLAVFRILTPADVAAGDLVLGAVLGGIGYTVLLTVGTALVQHQLRHAQAIYGQFAFVIGLMGWLNLVAQLSLYAAEVNVVRTRHLWPRSILQPPLTDADQHVLRDIARAEERRPEQHVSVGFEPEAGLQPSADQRPPPAD
ncbi:MAG TPA: YihY/virulence factor BrkB family protein [Acidimicrobiia bacterium]